MCKKPYSNGASTVTSRHLPRHVKERYIAMRNPLYFIICFTQLMGCAAAPLAGKPQPEQPVVLPPVASASAIPIASATAPETEASHLPSVRVSADALCAAMKQVQAIATRELGRDGKAQGNMPSALPPFESCAREKPSPGERPAIDPDYYLCKLGSEYAQFEFATQAFENCFATELTLARRSEADNNYSTKDATKINFDLVLDPKAPRFRFRNCGLRKSATDGATFSCGFHNGD
jgi:hypothetical protein